ncbi:hypothetical protein OGM63_24455 [Plectonema radiosum NIES-515]|uniref:Uncharacterized protein n=1 Tax=Plectonema radiosum NIES-515 TaxID=2986073 RepID=A0ABT3B5H1_9CYAN|nr:hypothetical protein [Plectonema radiosum]MCV3216620.1 hypothetical protein [Plectonema radiosum NIES-515]
MLLALYNNSHTHKNRAIAQGLGKKQGKHLAETLSFGIGVWENT